MNELTTRQHVTLQLAREMIGTGKYTAVEAAKIASEAADVLLSRCRELARRAGE